MGIHRQHSVFQGHGAQQVLLPLLSEGHRGRELLSLQTNYCSAPGTFYTASVGQLGDVGTLRWHAEPFQELPGGFGERGPGIDQHFHWFEPLPPWVSYVHRYAESSHSYPLTPRMAAWAAASRATGTRNGEHET